MNKQSYIQSELTKFSHGSEWKPEEMERLREAVILLFSGMPMVIEWIETGCTIFSSKLPIIYATLADIGLTAVEMDALFRFVKKVLKEGENYLKTFFLGAGHWPDFHNGRVEVVGDRQQHAEVEMRRFFVDEEEGKKVIVFWKRFHDIIEVGEGWETKASIYRDLCVVSPAVKKRKRGDEEDRHIFMSPTGQSRGNRQLEDEKVVDGAETGIKFTPKNLQFPDDGHAASFYEEKQVGSASGEQARQILELQDVIADLSSHLWSMKEELDRQRNYMEVDHDGPTSVSRSRGVESALEDHLKFKVEVLKFCGFLGDGDRCPSGTTEDYRSWKSSVLVFLKAKQLSKNDELVLLGQTLVMEARRRFDQWYQLADQIDLTIEGLFREWDVVYGEGDLSYWLVEKSSLSMKSAEKYDKFQVRADKVFRGYEEQSGGRLSECEKVITVLTALPEGQLRSYAEWMKDDLERRYGSAWPKGEYVRFTRQLRNKARNLERYTSSKSAKVSSLRKAEQEKSSDWMKNVRCWKCGDKGHISKFCQRGKVCFNCKEAGHMMRDCPDKEASKYVVTSCDLSLSDYQPTMNDKEIVIREALSVRLGLGLDVESDVGIDTHAEIVCVRDEGKESWKGPAIRVEMADGSLRTYDKYTTVPVWNPQDESLMKPMTALVVPELKKSALLGMPALMSLGMDLDLPNGTVRFEAIGFETRVESRRKYLNPNRVSYVCIERDEVIPAYSVATVSISTMKGYAGASGTGLFESWDPMFAPGVLELKSGCATAMVWNSSAEDMQLYSGVVVGSFTPGSDGIVCSLNLDGDQYLDESVENVVPLQDDYERMSQEELEQSIEKLLQQSDLSEESRVALGLYLRTKQKLFGCSGLGKIEGYEYDIELKEDDVAPPPQVIYDYPQAVREEGRKLMQKLVSEGVAVESDSEWSFPIVLVRKKNGTLRFCVDYRKLNKLLKPDRYPVPRIDRYLEVLSGEAYYTLVDLESGYFQLSVTERSRKYTAFSDGEKQFEFTRLPMGILPAVQVFQRTISAILSGLTFNMCLVYLDDIIIFSKTEEEHIVRVKHVFDRLEEAGVTLKLEKTQLGVSRVSYLGHILDRGDIRPDPEKVRAIREFPSPRTKSELKRFMGLVNWCSSYMPMLADKAHVLYKLLKKDPEVRFDDPEVLRSFESVKELITEEAAITIPRPEEELRLVVDGSKSGIGGALLVVRNGEERLVGCVSRSLRSHEANYATEDFETLSLIYTLEKFRLFLYGRKFFIYTDHKNLQYLYNHNSDFSKLRRDRVQRWKALLLEYDYEILYKRGVENVVADALSRSPVTVSSMRTLLLQEQIEDGIAPHSSMECVRNDSGQLVVPKSLVPLVIRLCHDKELNHLGVDKTYARLSQQFWWEKMRDDVSKYVENCWVCSSHSRYKMKGEFQCRDPTGVVSFDLIPSLPRTSSGNRHILVIQDLLTRYVICVPLRKKSEGSVAKAIYKHWISRFGIPRQFLSDDGREFKNAVLACLEKIIGVEEHVFSTPYHKQSNGINERSHRSLMKMVRTMVSSEGSSWDEVLDGIILAYNSAIHQAHGRSPFFLMFGHDPNLIGNMLFDEGSDDVGGDEALESRLREVKRLHAMYPRVLKRLSKQQKRRAMKWNRRLSRHKFRVGEVVLYTRNPGRVKKLDAQFTGPARIMKRYGPVSFQLKDLRTNRRYKVNISRMKPFLSNKEMSGKWRWSRESRWREEFPKAEIVRLDEIGLTITQSLEKKRESLLVLPKWEYSNWYKSFMKHNRVSIVEEVDSDEFAHGSLPVRELPWRSVVCRVAPKKGADAAEEEDEYEAKELTTLGGGEDPMDALASEIIDEKEKEQEASHPEVQERVLYRRSGRTRRSPGMYEDVDVNAVLLDERVVEEVVDEELDAVDGASEGSLWTWVKQTGWGLLVGSDE